MSCVTYNPIRTYVQYNDLVFSSADTIESASYRVSTKVTVTNIPLVMEVTILKRQSTCS